MEVKVELPLRLARVVGARSLNVKVENGTSVRDVLSSALSKEAYCMVVNGGGVAPGMLVLLNERDVRVLEGLNTKVNDGDVVTVLSVTHGG
ncbi:MAG: MoaD/ThiS family protein [Candidatus Jordarchaeales archaeon]|nr:MoaD/ThiS family protein [Candidatus Jordarchaeia archaeon]